MRLLSLCFALVAPLAGAWVETAERARPHSHRPGRAPCGRVDCNRAAARAAACSVSTSSSDPLSIATVAWSRPVALTTESTSAERAALALRAAFSLSSAPRRSSTVGSALGAVDLSSLSSLRFAFERFSHLRGGLQRLLVQRLVVGLLPVGAVLRRVVQLCLFRLGLFGHAPSIPAPCGARPAPCGALFGMKKATRADGLNQLWSGRRESNPHGRCPRAPDARASVFPPRPDVVN